MGLDMFAYRTSVKISKPVDFQDEIFMSNETNEDSHSQIAYWRKHYNLHEWMKNLYYKKGGVAESFNCVAIELELEDLNNLQTDIKNKKLFDIETKENKKDYLQFIKDAKEAIFEGDRVFYDSWW